MCKKWNLNEDEGKEEKVGVLVVLLVMLELLAPRRKALWAASGDQFRG